MSSEPPTAAPSGVFELYRAWIAAWNRQDAAALAALFADNGKMVGLDATEVEGPAEIERSLGDRFSARTTGPLVYAFQDIELLSADTAQLTVVAGAAPVSGSRIGGSGVRLQWVVVRRVGGIWRLLRLEDRTAGDGREAEAFTRQLQSVVDSQLPPGDDWTVVVDKATIGR